MYLQWRIFSIFDNHFCKSSSISPQIYISYIYVCIRCIPANDKISTLSKLGCVLQYSLHTWSGYCYTILSSTVQVLACNGLYRVYVGFVLYIGWRYKNDIARYCLFTTGIEQHHLFHCITKNWANTVLFSIGYAVSGIVIAVKEQYVNVVPNGTVWYCYDTVYRQYSAGTISVFT